MVVRNVKRWKFTKKVAWKVPRYFCGCACREDVILSIMELLRGTSLVNLVLMRKIVRIFTVSSKLLLKNEKDRTHAKTVIEANTDYHVVIA